MRTLNSAKNLASSVGITVVMTLVGFLTRKVFVDTIGVEYLGLNGLLSNILGVMALLEGGFASSVVYNLYKPLADDDKPKILALLQLYKKVYRYIALGVAACGIAIYPFLDYFIADLRDLPFVSFVYFIFLFNSLVRYFTAYKWSLINCSQKNYKLTTINLVYQLGLSFAKIAILFYTRNYILYLIVEAFFGLGLNWAIVKKADQMFPYIKTKEHYQVEPETQKNIVTNMKALFLHSLGGYFMHSTDNIILSSYIGLSIVGLYSNYTLLIGIVTGLVTQVLGSFSESVGNLVASESSDKVYEVFKTVLFVNFLVVSVPIIILFNVMEPFIRWWLGGEYEMGYIVLAIILLNFFVNNIRTAALTFKVKSGIFTQDRWSPLLQGVINLVFSIWWAQIWGITGVLAATAVAICSIGFWQFPRLIYKHTFHRPLYLYFVKLGKYCLVMCISLLSAYYICRSITISNALLTAIVNGIISLSVTIIIYFITLHRTAEYSSLGSYISVLRPKHS